MRLCDAHINKARAEGDQSADVTETPTPPRHAAQGVLAGKLRQERGDQVFATTEKKVREHDQREPERDVTAIRQRQRSGEQHAPYGGGREQPLLRGAGIGVGARDFGHEIGIEDSGDDNSGIARVGEVVHRPRKNLDWTYAGSEVFS